MQHRVDTVESLPNSYFIYTVPQFKNNHCWFEYIFCNNENCEKTSQTLLCVFKRLLLELNKHKHSELAEYTDCNAKTPYLRCY